MTPGGRGGERPSHDRRRAERDTLVEHVAWLHTQADAVAATQPALRGGALAVARASGGALAHELQALADTATRHVATSREEIEHLAAELRRTADAHASADVLAAGDLFGSRSHRKTLTARDAPTHTDVVRLVDDVSEDLPGDEGERCRARLARASESELALLSDVVDAGLTHDQLLQLLEGGHLLLPGHGLLERWRSLPGVEPRTSSHYHPDDRRAGRGPGWLEAARARIDDAHSRPLYGQQYGLRGTFVHEALFGPGPHHTTFVQLERAAPSKLRLPRHIADWARYRLTRRNQGPYGSSLDTESRPMSGRLWWKPSRRPDRAVRLDQVARETDAIARTLLSVSHQLDARGRLRSLVWRGPSSNDFDEAVERAIDDIARAAGAVSTLGARLRGHRHVA